MKSFNIALGLVILIFSNLALSQGVIGKARKLLSKDEVLGAKSSNEMIGALKGADGTIHYTTKVKVPKSPNQYGRVVVETPRDGGAMKVVTVAPPFSPYQLEKGETARVIGVNEGAVVTEVKASSHGPYTVETRINNLAADGAPLIETESSVAKYTDAGGGQSTITAVRESAQSIRISFGYNGKSSNLPDVPFSVKDGTLVRFSVLKSYYPDNFEVIYVVRSSAGQFIQKRVKLGRVSGKPVQTSVPSWGHSYDDVVLTTKKVKDTLFGTSETITAPVPKSGGAGFRQTPKGRN